MSTEKDEDAVEAISKVLFEHALKSARAEVDQVGVSISDARQFFSELAQETDAGLVVLSVSYIDTHLADAFKKNMLGLSNRSAEEIFENTGPLSTMSAKIRVARGLAWLSESTASDLHLLRKIRNAFAHDPYRRSIGDKEIADYVDSLAATEAEPLKFLQEIREVPPLTIRQQFHVRSAFVCFRMAIEMVCAPIALRHSLSPGTVMGSFEEGPELKRSMAREQASFLFYFLTKKNSETTPTT